MTPIHFTCSHCHAAPGEPCVRRDGQRAIPHSVRAKGKDAPKTEKETAIVPTEAPKKSVQPSLFD